MKRSTTPKAIAIGMLAGVAPLAGWEVRTALRTRWVIASAAVFAAACVAAAAFGLQSLRALGLGGAGAAIDALVNIGVLLPPLLALLLGSAVLSGAREGGMLALLGAQPVRRSGLVLGAFGGVVAAVSVTVAAGYGLVAVIAGGAATSGDLRAFAGLAAGTLGVIAAATAIGIAISAVSATRLQAAAAAVTLWFLMAFGFDVVTAAVAPGLAMGPQGLFAMLLGNPLEAARILALLAAGPDGSALGPFGGWLVGRFGSGGGTAVLAGALTAWTAVPLALAALVLRHQDL